MTQSKEKYYKFSGTKHAHDIEFRYARVKNTIFEMESVGDDEKQAEKYNSLCKLRDKLSELLGYMHEGVCEIPGRLYGLAQESVNWAIEERVFANVRRDIEARRHS